MIDDTLKIIIYILIAWFIITKLLSSKESYQSVSPTTGYSNLILADSTGNMNSIAFPRGMIMAYYGSIGTIPSGWALCNGSQGTPDLRGRFILGVNPNNDKLESLTAREMNTTGGEEKVTLTVDQIPPHNHRYNKNTKQCNGDCPGGDDIYFMTQVNSNETTMSTGGGKDHNNMPPFYTLAYLMKL